MMRAESWRRKMRGPWASGVLYLAVALFCAALAMGAAKQFAARKPFLTDDHELALFPCGARVTEISLGHARLLADCAWLAAIQYYGKHREGDRRYPLAPRLFAVLTDADPSFQNAYLFGSLIMAENGDLAAAESLLHNGVVRNPGAWRLQFELGFFHYVFTRSYAQAGVAFRRAAALPGAPDYVLRFAAAAWERSGEPGTAAELWAAVARASDNQEIRRMAEERLAALQAQEHRTGQGGEWTRR